MTSSSASLGGDVKSAPKYWYRAVVPFSDFSRLQPDPGDTKGKHADGGKRISANKWGNCDEAQ